MPFRDRTEAGARLARELARFAPERPLVLALPRGGVPVAAPIAKALGAPLDVIVARKLGAPHDEELGIGAVAPGGVRVLDARLIEALGVTPAQIERVGAKEEREVVRRLVAYRGVPAPPDARGRFVILVDDGLATGVTARAALRSLRQGGASRVVLAVPVGAADTVDALAREADEVVCLETPENFRAVGVWYDDFRATSDDEVVSLLAASRH